MVLVELIVDGRDLTLAEGAIAPFQGTVYGESQRDLTLHFAGLLWRPGDYVYADSNGIIVAADNLLG